MSRICGIINNQIREEQISVLIKDLITPMMHAQSFKSEVLSANSCAFAHILHNPNYTSSYLHNDKATGAYCLFNGYQSNVESMSQTIRQETNNQKIITNPAELISYLIIKKGPHALIELNGIFSFALWQPLEKNLWLGVDRYGMRPLFYSQQSNSVKFSSEVKSLSLTKSKAKTNNMALEEMFVLGYLLEDKTMYQGIYRVPPATVLKFHGNKVEQNRYWWYDQIQIDEKLTVDDYLVDNDKLFRSVIENISKDLNDVSCLLSSGYDSRRIILELSKTGKNIHSFTTAHSKSKDKYEVELGITKHLSAKLGINHTTVEHAYPKDVPINLFNMYTFLNCEADEHQFIMNLLSKIPIDSAPSFDGLGGDIIINGLFLRKDILDVIHDNKKLTRIILARHPNLWNSYVKYDPNQPTLDERIQNILNELPDSPNKYSQFLLVTRTRREIGLSPFGLLNLKIESYLPYLDNKLFEQSFSIHPELKCGTNLQEKILRLKYNNLMDAIPNSHMKNITMSLSDSNRKYCQPLGNYWNTVEREIYSASCKEILNSGNFFSSLSFKAKLICIGYLVMNLFNTVPKFIIRKSWSMKILGQLAFLHNMIRDKDEYHRRLNKAREFIFSNDKIGHKNKKNTH